MKQPDNHIDETLEDILFEYENGQNPHQDEDYRFERTKKKLDQYYADFYRNKILEARIDELNQVMGNLHDNPDCITCYNNHTKLERHYKDITAQFNSGGSDAR